MSFGSWSMHSFWALSSIWKTDIPRQEMYRFDQCFTKPLLHKRRHQRKQFVKSVQQKQTHKCTQLSTGSCNPSPRLHDWGSEVPVCRSPLESLSACKWQPQWTYCQHKNSTNRYSAVKYTQSWDSSAHKQLQKHANCVYKSSKRTSACCSYFFFLYRGNGTVVKLKATWNSVQ